ncbi:tat pathway signal sequence [Diplocarpon rosae]|nr:tat pathway signal sequence [Diplocarpon rosae]
MASSKEILPHSSRHIGTNRLSTSTTSGSLPKSHARNHSSSASSGSLIANHRVSRRKSVSSNTASNVAAMVAAAREAGDTTLGMPITGRRNMSKSASARSIAQGSLPSPPASLPGHRYKLAANGKSDRGESAIDDDQNDVKEEDDEKGPKQSRIRRASEGQYRTKDGKKAHGSDLKCEKCGKGYKHSSCLSKHLWEHTPEWSLTSKLLISKHQQVQLLEAASVLVAMNQEGATPPDSAKDFQSDQESASPAASGSSELHDGTSSTDTTPPPQGDMVHVYSSGSYTGRHKRFSSGHSFSRSYQSAAGANRLSGGSIPSGPAFGYYRQQSQERRPLSSGIGTTLTPSHHPRQTESYTRHQLHNDGDIKMEDSEESLADDEEYDRGSRGRSDEDDDGVFGRMEE